MLHNRITFSYILRLSGGFGPSDIIFVWMMDRKRHTITRRVRATAAYLALAVPSSRPIASKRCFSVSVRTSRAVDPSAPNRSTFHRPANKKRYVHSLSSRPWVAGLVLSSSWLDIEKKQVKLLSLSFSLSLPHGVMFINDYRFKKVWPSRLTSLRLRKTTATTLL